MTRAVNPEAKRSYVCSADRELPQEEQTEWEIVQLTAAEQAHVQNISERGGTMILHCLHLGLAGAKKFYAEGVPVAFTRDAAALPIVGQKRPWRADVIDRIPPVERDELAAEILKGTGIERGQAKNS